MNERIRELAERAGFSFKYKTVPDELNPGHKLQDLEKFAELIVRECISTVENLSPGYQDYRNQIEDAFRRDCVAKILEHFGVEE